MSNRDYKSSSRPARSSARGHGKKGGGLMTGLLIGLIVGVGVVVGVTMFLNRSSTPFSNLQKQEARQQGASEALPDVTLLAPGAQLREAVPASAAQSVAPVPVAPPASDAAASKPAQAVAPEGDRFDFYKILPGKIDAVPGTPAAPDTATAPAVRRHYSLQAGAFANESEADNLKAKLALMGVEASIHSVETATGLLHRVRVGPFTSQAEAEQVRSQLKAGGVAADLIKP